MVGRLLIGGLLYPEYQILRSDDVDEPSLNEFLPCGSKHTHSLLFKLLQFLKPDLVGQENALGLGVSQ